MTQIHPAALAKFVRSVAFLALPCENQITWLSSLGMGSPQYADELALELEAGALLVRQFEEAGWISSEARLAAESLDDFLANFSGPMHEDFWRLESLRDSSEWAHVRALAVLVLTAI